MIISNNDKLDFAFELFKAMQKDNLGHIYRGLFTQSITDSILSLTETNLDKEEESPKIKKRVYAIMVECLQNVTRHQGDDIENDPENLGLFVIQKQASKYFLTTGNLVENADIEKIEGLISKINSLEKDELKKYYKQVLTEGSLSEKGGAGLGLIDMARKSGNKLGYRFKDVNEKYSYFYLHTIPSIISDTSEGGSDSAESLNNIIEIHKSLNREEVLLIFNGVFNQESLLHLLETVQQQMKGSESAKKKVFNVIVEMLQNIVKHGDSNYDKYKGNPGLFFISEKNNGYVITTGNFVKQEKLKEIQGKLEHLNKLSNKEVVDYYDENLMNFENEDSKKTGLGFLDLRIKSENELNYNFYKIDNEYAFFSLQTTISIKE